MSMEKRLAKLEHLARSSAHSDRDPGVTESDMRQIRAVAATVGSASELEAYLSTLEPATDGGVISLDDRRRSEATRKAFARAVFEEVHTR
ncbi:hypothetical protein GRI40_08945 [Altererythrobacter aerius]|uniref:Uncharacterized protein n=1 Tax=Tsuneonella aeria TaxID=1837929 RepID=A0A6I4TFU5_9SPHN|nr:hypothetical protein [Tsuneonella aeria]MXO75338.1 hypothetical protein [Tsuneonella aeria]